MLIQVRLFATLRAYAPQAKIGAALPVELPDGACIHDLVQHFNMPVDLIKLAYVNGVYQELDYPLHDQDQVGLFPPVGGG